MTSDAASALRISEAARLARMAEQMAGVGHWHLNLAADRVYWSEQVYRIYGLDPAATGDPDLARALASYHPDDQPKLRALIDRAAATGEGFDFELRLIREGEERIVVAKAETERDANGVVSAIFGIFMDVTELKRVERSLRASEERFRALAENCSDMLVCTSIEGQFIYLSPAVKRISGHDPDELTGMASNSFILPEDQSVLEQAVIEASRREDKRAPATVRYRGYAKDRRLLWLESRPFLQTDPETGAIISIIDVARDITEQVRMEGDLIATRDAAEAAAAAKSAFLANISHELRTPLTALSGFSELLNDSDKLPERERHFAARIQEASRALIYIVDDLLDVTRIESGNLNFEFESFAVDDVVDEVFASVASDAARKGLQLITEIDRRPLVFSGDAMRIRQILLNLVGNAVKFTPSGSVTVKAEILDTGVLSVEVRDTGPGINPDNAGWLFQRFTQADSSITRPHGGLGLGLAICKGLTEGMGGVIGFDRSHTPGACFRFELPPAPPA